MRSVSIPRQWEDITLEAKCGLDAGVVLLCSGERKRDKIVIRSGTYINRYTIIDAHQSVEIGQNVMIGPGCFITDADHGGEKNRLVTEQLMKISPVKIEAGAWLGAHVVVLKGARIGRGAIVGAGSVVTSEIGENKIAAGVPARIIGARV